MQAMIVAGSGCSLPRFLVQGDQFLSLAFYMVGPLWDAQLIYTNIYMCVKM